MHEYNRWSKSVKHNDSAYSKNFKWKRLRLKKKKKGAAFVYKTWKSCRHHAVALCVGCGHSLSDRLLTDTNLSTLMYLGVDIICLNKVYPSKVMVNAKTKFHNNIRSYFEILAKEFSSVSTVKNSRNAQWKLPKQTRAHMDTERPLYCAEMYREYVKCLKKNYFLFLL